ncbi:MAG: helix-turn-helix domain-containing protein [Acidobacteriota bacterium]
MAPRIDDPFLITAEVGKLTNQSTRTLEKWRQNGTGPSYFRMGRSVRYRLSDVEAWLEQCRRISTSDRGE